jgi:L-threonylcarbamoyladenylate synthase
MPVRTVDPANIDAASIAEAAAIILRGGVVAFPTETVYGLGANATDINAVGRIFAAKGRPIYNPLIVHVADVAGARACVTQWPQVAQTLVSRFWPGPLTIVLPKAPKIPDIVTAGLPTVGVRVPAHPVALALLRAANVPIAAPSANRSMQVSPTAGEHVAASLGAAPDLILDAGPSAVGIESTVLDLTTSIPTILRPGMVTIDVLRDVIGRVDTVASRPADGEARASPGMMDRHYSPNARVIISGIAGAADVTDIALREESRGARVVVITRSPVAEDAFAVWRMPDSPAEYARQLYATLHRADAEGYGVIVVETLPDTDAWSGVRDRLARAAR